MPDLQNSGVGAAQPKAFSAAALPKDCPPLLVVVIDTEEEFDWARRFDRANRSVKCIQEQLRAQDIFARHEILPTYVMDHPVAATAGSAAIFRELLAQKACLVGAHLHPWVNPPDEEAVNERNSYPGNLEAGLEFRKLEILTKTIEQNIGQRPVIYKAGRYGYGPKTTGALLELGYKIDLSVVPHTDLTSGQGPNFRGLPDRPYWAGPRGELFELPLSCGFAGALGRFGPGLFPLVSGPLATRLHLPGIAARLGLLERIILTPEGITLDEQKRLVRAMAGRGAKVFSYTYHSSSLLAGGSPYVKDAAARDLFLAKMDMFFSWFKGEMGGRASNPHEVMNLCLKAKDKAA